jgi:hypothetical protein
MNCFCCGREVAIARKVKIRRWCSYEEWRGGPESAAYKAYEEQMTHRWGGVCPGCYMTLETAAAPPRSPARSSTWPAPRAPIGPGRSPLSSIWSGSGKRRRSWGYDSRRKQKNRGQKNQNRRVLIFLPQMFLHWGRVGLSGGRRTRQNRPMHTSFGVVLGFVESSHGRETGYTNGSTTPRVVANWRSARVRPSNIL